MVYGMAHIVYDGKFYDLAGDSVASVIEEIKKYLATGGAGVLTIVGSDGDKSHLFLSPGVNIAINEWDAPFG